ncbi:MAG TPA: hypothetical protein VIK06_01565 [Candidatus Limnocylindrales bacterium]
MSKTGTDGRVVSIDRLAGPAGTLPDPEFRRAGRRHGIVRA